MSYQHFRSLVEDLCRVVGLPDAEDVLRRRNLEVEGFHVYLGHDEQDPHALYLVYDFGVINAGRSLRVFRLMLEANRSVYASDQALLGMDAATGGINLLVRCPFSDELDGQLLAETLGHYAEHGRYWQLHILSSTDDIYESLVEGRYAWIRT